LSVDLNSSKTDKAAQNGRTPKSLTLEIHHGGWFTPTPSRSYNGGHVSPVNVVDIDEFCLHDLKDMVVKLGYGVEDLMYCHFLIPSLGLDYGLHSLNVDADVLEMSKYVKDYKIMLVYVKHGSSIVDTSMFDSSLDVNRNVRKEWEKVSSKSSSIGEVMKKLSKEQPASSVARPIVVESAIDPFDGLDEILGSLEDSKDPSSRIYTLWEANTRKERFLAKSSRNPPHLLHSAPHFPLKFKHRRTYNIVRRPFSQRLKNKSPLNAIALTPQNCRTYL
ncbi:hypothetical protein Tco_1521526, partial [Tanacetum coccineum]